MSQLTTQQFPHKERLCFCLLMRLWINRVAFSFMGPWMPTCEFNVGFGRACAWEWKWQYGMVLVTKGTHPEIESLALMWWAALHSWSENDVWNADCLVLSLPRPKGPQLKLKYEPANHVFQIFVGPISSPLGKAYLPLRYLLDVWIHLKRYTQKKHWNCCSALKM